MHYVVAWVLLHDPLHVLHEGDIDNLLLEFAAGGLEEYQVFHYVEQLQLGVSYVIRVIY